MQELLRLFILIGALMGSILLGNWYLTESRSARQAGKPWYAASYLSKPAILIITLMIVLPLLAQLFS